MVEIIIDNEHLIVLVEARPVLWDKTLDVYRDRIATKNAWMEVCKELNSKFEELEDNEKTHYVKEVTRRWTNLRDAFSRSRKRVKCNKKSGAGAVIVKKYVFNDQMKFLLKCYESRSTADSFDNAENPEASNEELDEEVTEFIEQRTERIANNKRRKIDELELQMLKALQQPEQDPDSHKSFLYSLLPYLNTFNQSETLEFQMDVLQIISKITERKRNAQPQPAPPYTQQYYIPQTQPNHPPPAFTPTIQPPSQTRTHTAFTQPPTTQQPPSKASQSRPQTTFSGFLTQSHNSNSFDSLDHSAMDNNSGVFSPTVWSDSSGNIDYSPY